MSEKKEQGIDNFNTVIVGEQGMGKTYFSLNKIVLPYINLERKILILHHKNHPDYKHIQKIKITQLAAWCRRKDLLGPAFCYYDDTDVMLEIILRDFDQMGTNSGLIILDDFTSWHTGKMSKNLKKLIIDPKQSNYDLIVQAHSMEDVPKGFLSKVQVLILFKTKDNIEQQTLRLPNAFRKKYKTAALNLLNNYQKEDYKFFIIK